MSFATVVNCMDGRIQIPVNSFLKSKLNVNYIDTITEPGPNKILSENKDKNIINSILKRIEISLNIHKSTNICIVGHADCAGNPTKKAIQLKQLKDSIDFIKKNVNKEIMVFGLWVDENLKVHELE